jgi:hypothetical protein
VDQRKAKALGIIGRGEQGQYVADAGDHAAAEDPTADPASPTGPTTKPDRRRRGAPTKLYLHINHGDLAGHAVRGAADTDTAPIGTTPAGTVERLGQATLDLLANWLGHDQFTLTPVLDLNRTEAVDAHDPPLWMRELVILRDKHCIFPWCATDARSCDLDHIVAYRQGSPPGQTHPDNLAPLCRRHHNIKTHGRWRYARNRDGTYTWTSRHRLTYLVTKDGTVRLD